MDWTNLTSGLIGAVLGAAASFFGNLLIESVRANRDEQAKRKNLALSLKLEFEASLKSLNEIKNTLNAQSFYPFRWTKVLSKSIESLEKERPKFYLLTDSDLQEKMFQLITDMALFISDVEITETIWNSLQEDPPKRPDGSEIKNPNETRTQTESVKEQRRLKSVELVDLKRRIDEIIRELSK
jgi:hypothetical protein